MVIIFSADQSTIVKVWRYLNVEIERFGFVIALHVMLIAII